MPLPSAGDVHVNAMLGNISIAFLQRAENFVSDKMFPVIPSAKQSDRYFSYDREDYFRDQMKLRAPATESAGGGWRIDNTNNFHCDVWSLHKDVDDQVRANQDTAISMDRDATEWLTQQALIRRDSDFAAQYFTTGKWSQDIVPVTKWNDAAGTPILELREAIFDIAESTGFRPNKLLLGARAWQGIQDSADFLGRIVGGATTGTPALVEPRLLAQVLELDEVVVAWGVSATSLEGAATPTFGFIHGSSALLCYSNPSPSLLTPSAGYTFTWSGLTGAGAAGMRMKRFRMDALSADRMEIDATWDNKLVSSDLGVFFDDVLLP